MNLWNAQTWVSCGLANRLTSHNHHRCHEESPLQP